jgi:3-methyladenine DNA glycosylase Mpg
MPESQTSTPTAQIRSLERAFYSRDPRRVARELLGKVLVRKCGRQRLTPRIGITKAVDKPLRYILEGNPFVSRKTSG